MVIRSWHGSQIEINAIEKAGFKESYFGKGKTEHFYPFEEDPFDVAKKIYINGDVNVAIVKDGTFSYGNNIVVAVSDDLFRMR